MGEMLSFMFLSYFQRKTHPDSKFLHIGSLIFLNLDLNIPFGLD